MFGDWRIGQTFKEILKLLKQFDGRTPGEGGGVGKGWYPGPPTVHNWVQKADLEPRGSRDSENIALDETVVKVNGERFWLVAAGGPETNVILHVRLYPSRNAALTKIFFRKLKEKHVFDDAEFFVDGAPWLHAGLFELGTHLRREPSANATQLNVSFKR